MPKTASELGALQVQRLTKPGFHAVGGVAGLYLLVQESGSRQWILRVKVGAKRREMGLGGYPSVTLAQAREAARVKREQIVGGTDPVEARRKAKSAMMAEQNASISFKDAAVAFIAAHEAGWRNDKHAKQWASTLEAYAYPVIGSMRARHIKLSHMLQILEPIWATKTETAKRVRGRIEKILDWCKGRGYVHGDNVAAWKGNLDAQLAKPEQVTEVENFPALPFQKAAAFWQRLTAVDGMGALALRLVILTATRSNQVRGARWPEFDLDAGLWLVPAERMKAKKAHRVALSDAAVIFLRSLPKLANPQDLVFPSATNTPLSDMTLTAVIRRLNEADRASDGGPLWIDPKLDREIVPHGFRSTFYDWSAEVTKYPKEMSDMALAHVVSDKVEAAYRRGDMFMKRVKMMNDWALYLEGRAPARKTKAKVAG